MTQSNLRLTVTHIALHTPPLWGVAVVPFRDLNARRSASPVRSSHVAGLPTHDAIATLMAPSTARFLLPLSRNILRVFGHRHLL